MEARMIALALALTSFLWCGANYRTPNFAVSARTPELAKAVGDQAEGFRKQLALYWLGRELPDWSDICPIEVVAAPNLGAGGATTFTFHSGTVGRWNMSVQGTEQRILDSVLPHEITHTILATHFASLGRPVPRWADEGACTTMEHISERSKFDRLLLEYLSKGQAFSFQQLYHITDYPQDPLPLYAQGYSLVSFLVAQGGPRKFVRYLQDGMMSNDWGTVTKQYYGFSGLGHVKNNWLAWIGDGGGDVTRYAAMPIVTEETATETNSTALADLSQPLKLQPTGKETSQAETAIWVASPNVPERTWHAEDLGVTGGIRKIKQQAIRPASASEIASPSTGTDRSTVIR